MKVKEIRALTALNRAEFARKYEIPYKTIERWETGKNDPPEYILKWLERLVKIDKEENKMKKFKVSYKIANQKMIAGEESWNDIRVEFDDYVEGENRLEVIDAVFSNFTENIDFSAFDGEAYPEEDLEKEEYVIVVDGEKQEMYYDFSVVEA